MGDPGDYFLQLAIVILCSVSAMFVWAALVAATGS